MIFDSTATMTDAGQLRKAMVNAGFLDATVSVDTFADRNKRKMKVEYNLHAGMPHIIRSVNYEFPNDTPPLTDNEGFRPFHRQTRDPLDISLLETQRELLTTRLRSNGYYAFGKEFITFNADTTEGSHDAPSR